MGDLLRPPTPARGTSYDTNRKGVLRRIFDKTQGGPVSPELGKEWPELSTAWDELSKTRPDLANSVTRIKPFNAINRLLIPSDATGKTDFYGQIAINRPLVEEKMKSGELNLTDLLAHEATHAKQSLPGYVTSKLGGFSDIIGEKLGYPKGQGLIPAWSEANKQLDYEAVNNEKFKKSMAINPQLPRQEIMNPAHPDYKKPRLLSGG